ncbi:MAG: hypothetical protein AAGA85_21500, partial [Bacteroidota bacterium]
LLADYLVVGSRSCVLSKMFSGFALPTAMAAALDLLAPALAISPSTTTRSHALSSAPAHGHI